jgi:hypothetical protein
MQLAPRDPSLPFVLVKPILARPGNAPVPVELDWQHEPSDTTGLVTVRYHGLVVDRHASDRAQLSVRNDQNGTGEPWYAVSGSIDDAIAAARELAVVEGFDDDPQAGTYARTSVAVLDAGAGTWHLARMQFSDGMGDGMDALISMPIDRVPAAVSQVSVPYGSHGAGRFDTPDKVMVRFDDPRVAALVGVGSVALAPSR